MSFSGLSESEDVRPKLIKPDILYAQHRSRLVIDQQHRCILSRELL
jgi:hypothetical protein